jgi:hypothetical protein
LRNLISVISFVMAVFSSLVVLFIKDREKQKMASIVALVFLLSFFVNISGGEKLFLQIACMTSFALAILSGIVSIFSNEEHTRIASMVIGVVALGVSLLILFTYLEFRPF